MDKVILKTKLRLKEVIYLRNIVKDYYRKIEDKLEELIYEGKSEKVIECYKKQLEDILTIKIKLDHMYREYREWALYCNKKKKEGKWVEHEEQRSN